MSESWIMFVEGRAGVVDGGGSGSKQGAFTH